MKAAVILAAAGLVAAQVPDISAIPACAQTCLLTGLTASGCSSDISTECLCQPAAIAAIKKSAIPCVEKACGSSADIDSLTQQAEAICGGSTGSSSSASAAPASSTAEPSLISGEPTPVGSATSMATSEPSGVAPGSGGVIAPGAGDHSSVYPVNGTAGVVGATATGGHGGVSPTTGPITAAGTVPAVGAVAALLAAALAL